MINRINTARQVKALLALLLPLNVVKLLLKLLLHPTNERQVSEEEVQIVLQAHAEGSSLRGISRISGLAYDTVVSPSASSPESANGTQCLTSRC